MMRHVVAALLAMSIGTPVHLAAQRWDDTVHTADGVCRVWALPPGGSNFPDDASYTRCALDRAPVLLPGQPMPPQPRIAGRAAGSIFVVVRPDGTVDPDLTRPRTRGMDTAFYNRAISTVRAWRFEPGMRDGAPVRSAFGLVLESDDRIDTLPARLVWSSRRGVDEDTLTGAWVQEPLAPPFAAGHVDRIYTAMLRRLILMQVVVPRHGNPYCLVLEHGDSVEHARLSSIAASTAYEAQNRGWFAPFGCERSPAFVRLVLPRIHRTEDGRAVLYPSGDYLPRWPPGLDGASWRAWTGRCVAQVSANEPTTVECPTITPYSAPGEFSARFRERAWYRAGWRAPTSDADEDSVSVRVIVTTRDAFHTDTVQTILRGLPRLDARAVNDPIPPCGGWSAHSPDGSREQYVVHGDPRGATLSVTRVSDLPVPSSPSSTMRCHPQAPLTFGFTAFLLGGIGEPVTSPITLCFSRCAKSYVLDPAHHTLAEDAHIRFRLSDLREHTRSGDQVFFRILVDPPPENLLPIVIVRSPEVAARTWIPRRAGPNAWDYVVLYTREHPQDTEFLIYLASR